MDRGEVSGDVEEEEEEMALENAMCLPAPPRP